MRGNKTIAAYENQLEMAASYCHGHGLPKSEGVRNQF